MAPAKLEGASSGVMIIGRATCSLRLLCLFMVYLSVSVGAQDGLLDVSFTQNSSSESGLGLGVDVDLPLSANIDVKASASGIGFEFSGDEEDHDGKLSLTAGGGSGIDTDVKIDLNWGSRSGGSCSARKCIKVAQHATGPNSLFNVQMINICLDCYLCHVHAYCPNFISTIWVDPAVFRRNNGSDTDCIVNGGHGFFPGHMLVFTYGASFQSEIRPSTALPCKRRRRRRYPRVREPWAGPPVRPVPLPPICLNPPRRCT